MMNKKRPKHLALHKIELPLPGFVSILHRVSGVFLFLALPLFLWMLQASMRSIETYTQLVEILQHPISKLVLLGLLWSFMHHFFAGIRYLALDLHLLSSLARARASSKWVMGASLLLTVVIGVRWLW
jgi:succinate dehydrogenase / fumarate reductase, cytochrome b subunit